MTESSVPVDSATTRSRRRRRRTWTRRLLWALVVGIVVVVSYVGITFVQVVHTSHRDDARSPSAPKAQAVIVLGTAQYNGRPSPVLEARLAHALQLYRWGLAPVMVVTGGRRPGDRYTEATTGYNYLRAHGVPDSAIRKEVKGGTTWESLQAATRFLHAEHIDHVILVSDGYHSLRLLEIAGEVGLHAPRLPVAGAALARDAPALPTARDGRGGHRARDRVPPPRPALSTDRRTGCPGRDSGGQGRSPCPPRSLDGDSPRGSGGGEGGGGEVAWCWSTCCWSWWSPAGSARRCGPGCCRCRRSRGCRAG